MCGRADSCRSVCGFRPLCPCIRMGRQVCGIRSVCSGLQSGLLLFPHRVRPLRRRCGIWLPVLSGSLCGHVPVVRCGLASVFAQDRHRSCATVGSALCIGRAVGAVGGYLMIDVCGLRTPLASVRKALALPKRRYMSSRTGRWFLSSVM